MWLERIVLGLALLAAGPAAVAAPVSATDQVVVAGGGLTEILYALGAQDHIVGVDTTSTWPPPVLDKPKVGYLRSLAAEGILSLSPTLVITTDDAGPPKVLELIRASGVPVRELPAPHSPAQLEQAIRTLAQWFGREAAGQALVEALNASLTQARQQVQGYPDRPPVLFVLQASTRLLAAGQGTAADAMIELAGGRNVASFKGYKPLTPEAAAQLAPQVILTVQHVLDGFGDKQTMLAQPALALTPAGREGRLVAMPAERLLGFGPRLGQTVAELAHKLHEPDSP